MSSNPNANRLLDMLKSATSPPPSSTPPSTFLQPAQTSGSAREPSPAPPPPSLQAVSLQDLFASMTMATPSPPVVQPIPKVEGGDHQARMLGMLGNLGRGTPSPSQVNLHGVDSADEIGMPSEQDSHRDNLLNMFKSTQLSIPSLATGPVITQSTVPEDESVEDTEDTVQGEIPPQNEAPTPQPPVQPTQPKKSIFDFVSPFDVFDKPKPTAKPASPAPPPVQVKKEKLEPPQVQKPVEEPVKQSTSSHEVQPPTPVKAPNGVAGKSSALPKHVRERQPSGTSSFSAASSGKGDLGLVWQVGKVVPKGIEGQGPKRLKQHTVIDLSKPNIDGLITTDVAQVIPTTILKTDNIGYLRGRTVGMTQNWLAYTMSRGRVRLIDRASGSRVILQLPPSASSGHILDLAVTDTLVGILGPDHSVTVFEVPNGWDRDDPACEMVSHLLPGKSQPTEKPVQVEQVEWIRKSSGHALAIGGRHGLVVVDLEKLRETAQGMDLVTLTSQHKLLKSEGALVSFCVNRTHQAIGVLSDKSYLSLYNISNSNRVWHRPVPTNSPDSVPSSLRFVEAHILIGRANDTILELMQITTDVGTLSSIRFIAPQPSPPHLHFTKSVYDPTNQILWVSPFARGSLYGFKYVLKGHPPIPGLSGGQPTEVMAFDKVGEYPMESVLSMVLGPSGVEGNVEVFFATSVGFSQGIVPKEACEALNVAYEKLAEGEEDVAVGARKEEVLGAECMEAEREEGIEVKQTETEVAEKEQGVSVKVEDDPPSQREPKASAGAAIGLNTARQSPVVKPSSKQQSPPAVPAVLPPSVPTSQVKEPTVAGDKGSHVNGDRPAPGVSSDEMQRALKKTEDKLANSFKQAITNQVGSIVGRLDGLSTDLAKEVTASVNKTVMSSLTSLIQQEIKKTVLSSVNTTIQNEVRSTTKAAITTAVQTGLQAVSRDLEAGLTPMIQRLVGGIVQDLVQRSLIPAVTGQSDALGERLIAEFKSEMIQVRKDLPPPVDNAPMETILRNLTAQMSDLQQQVAVLTSRLGPSAPQPVPVQSHPPPPPQVAPPPPQPQQVQAPSSSRLTTAPAQLEEQFMTVLQSANPNATLSLVAEHWGGTDYLFPLNGRSLLSQAILLTLLHRLAIALKDVPPNDPIFGKVVTWEKRILLLSDPRDPEVSTYHSKVMTVVQQVLAETANRLHARAGSGQDGVAQEALKGVVELLTLIGQRGPV